MEIGKTEAQAGVERSTRNHQVYSRDQTGFRWMYVVDGATLFGLIVAISNVRFGTEWPNYSRTSYLIGFAIATAVHLTAAYFGGLYERENRLGNPSRLARCTQISITAALIMAAFSLGADQFLMPRINLAVYTVTSALVLAFNRWLAQSLITARFGRPKVLLIGSPDDIDLVESHLDETDKDAVVVGRRSTSDRLLQLVDETEATDVLLLRGCDLSEIYPDPLGVLESRRIGVYHRLEPVDTLLGLHKTRQIAGIPFVAVRSHALAPSKAHFKRLLDLVYLVVTLPLLVIAFSVLSLYALIVAGRPVFYRQDRVGRYGRRFKIAKFRTMYPGSEADTGPVLADVDDVRVIPAMKWMRATRMDELPQLWNVVRGDMSLVGPRPERPEMVDRFEQVLPGYGRRHDMRPGITGLAQVHGRYHTDPGYKLGHDLQYLVNWSPIFDFQILMRSVVVVVARRV